MNKNVYEALVELSVFFKYLCSKSLNIATLEKLEQNIVITLYKLERVLDYPLGH